MSSMRAPAQALGGTFDVRSAPGAGYVVEVRLP
jgi:signal transduction histidine kinase